jgi:hypothetical protein
MACGVSFPDARVLPFITITVWSPIWESTGSTLLLWWQHKALSVDDSAASEGFAGYPGVEARRLGYLFAGPQDATQIGCAIQVGACLQATALGT